MSVLVLIGGRSCCCNLMVTVCMVCICSRSRGGIIWLSLVSVEIVVFSRLVLLLFDAMRSLMVMVMVFLLSSIRGGRCLLVLRW